MDEEQAVWYSPTAPLEYWLQVEGRFRTMLATPDQTTQQDTDMDPGSAEPQPQTEPSPGQPGSHA